MQRYQLKPYIIFWAAEGSHQRFETVVLWAPKEESWGLRGARVGRTIVWCFQVSQKKVKQEVAC